MSVEHLVNAHIRSLRPYEPGKPIEEVERELGIAHSVKLASNENPLGPSPKALEALGDLFGVQSLALVEQHDWSTLDDIVQTGERLFREAVRDRTFAVRARRVGDRRAIPFLSEEVQRALGAALFPGARGVSLGSPEVTAALEIMPGDDELSTRPLYFAFEAEDPLA